MKKNKLINEEIEDNSKESSIKSPHVSDRIELSKTTLMQILQNNTRFMISIIPVIFIIVLILSIFTQSVLLYSSNYQHAEYQGKITELENDQKNINQVNDRYTEERIKKILTMNDIYTYTRSLWEYSFTANNENIDGQEISIAAIESKVTIVLTETQIDNPLPASIINIGSVTQGDKEDSIERHMNISDTRATKTFIKEGNTNKLEFVVDGVKSGDKVLIDISDQLAAKINNPFSQITITVK